MKKFICLSLFILLGATVYAQNGVSDKGYIYRYSSSYNYYCEEGVLFVKNDGISSGNSLVKYPQSKQTTSYTIPNWVKTIAKGAFKGNKYIKTIRIPSSILYIGDNAFDDCDQLTSIELYESTSAVGAVEPDDLPSDAREVGRYNIQGVKVQEDEDGQVQIILYSDGSSKKVVK